MKGPPRFITEDHELTPQEVGDMLEAEANRRQQELDEAEAEYNDAIEELQRHLLSPQPKIVKRQVEVFPDDPRYNDAPLESAFMLYPEIFEIQQP